MIKVNIGDYLAEIDELEQQVNFTDSLLKKVTNIVKTNKEYIYVCEDDFGIPLGYSSQEYGEKFVKVSKTRVQEGDTVKVYFVNKNLRKNRLNIVNTLIGKVRKTLSDDRFYIEGQDISVFVNDEGTSWEKVE